MGGNPRKESCAVLTRSWNWFEASSVMEERDKWRWGSPFCLMWPLWTPGIIHISSQAIWSALSTWSGWATAEQKRQQKRQLLNGDQDASRCSSDPSYEAVRAMREKTRAAKLALLNGGTPWCGNPLPCD